MTSSLEHLQKTKILNGFNSHRQQSQTAGPGEREIERDRERSDSLIMSLKFFYMTRLK